MLEFCVLSSGSKANCFYVSDGDIRVLIDCGLSARETAARLAAIGVLPSQINAIVVTHEHHDHVCGIPNFVKLAKCSVFANPAAIGNSRALKSLSADKLLEFETSSAFSIGDLLFQSFSIFHDAADPVGYVVRSGELSLGVATDLGCATDTVRGHLSNNDAIILESNHDPELLKLAPYPWDLKQRILGREGHLSNGAASDLLTDLIASQTRMLQCVVAAHISENSNTPDLAVDGMKAAWSEKNTDYSPHFVAGSVRFASKLFNLDGRLENPASVGNL